MCYVHACALGVCVVWEYVHMCTVYLCGVCVSCACVCACTRFIAVHGQHVSCTVTL